MHKSKTFEKYLERHPQNLREFAIQFRQVIKEAVPEADETSLYEMPAFKLNGVLCYFAIRDKYFAFYPGGSATERFMRELTPYRVTKGAVCFLYDEPLPIDLINKILRFRAAENIEKPRKPYISIKKKEIQQRKLQEINGSPRLKRR